MASSLTLATLEARVSAILVDASNAIWTTAMLDAGIRLALGKFNEFHPLKKITTVTLASDTRELSLSGVSDLRSAGDVTSVWFPYVSTEPLACPEWAAFDVYNLSGTLYLRLNSGDDPASGDVARVWYNALHTLNGLDAASATTFEVVWEGAIAKGAAAYCAIERSVDVSETTGTAAVSTPNLAALGQLWMQEFLDSVSPRPAGVSAFPGYRVRSGGLE